VSGNGHPSNQSQAATPPTIMAYSGSCRRRTRNWHVVVIDEPSRDVMKSAPGQGGTVAAPVFASVMSGALRLMDVPRYLQTCRRRPWCRQRGPIAPHSHGCSRIAAVPANDAQVADLAIDS